MLFRRLLFTIGLVLVMGTSFVFPVGTFAAEDTCECYCNIEGQGATKYSNASTVDRCQELCREDGFSVATCAMQPSQKPQYNVMCFTPDECTDQKGIRTATGIGNPVQPGECKQGMFYCYPDPTTRKEVTLQIPIGDLTVTGDFGEYVSVAYKWMLGVGTTIAIVFVMVSGLRWTLGGVNAEEIGKAKKTIQNAVIGLVLLMSTYVIIFTVNPYLVRLQVPAFPMIKLISLVGTDSCGFLTGQWGDGSSGHYPYLIENGAPYDSPYAGAPLEKVYGLDNYTSEACGSIADVVSSPEGEILQADRTCTFDYCQDSSDRCFPASGVGCLSCSDFAYGGDAPIEPTSSICSAFDKVTMNGGKIASIETCTFYNGQSLTSGLAALIGIDISAYTGNPFCYYQKSGTCGSSCSSYKFQSDCETDLCKLSCEWQITSTSSSRRTGEEFEIGSCVSKE